jgi:branched-subunit amino acid transport protein AzlD
MINTSYALIVIALMCAVTVALRALPFIGARVLQRYPVVEQLGRFLPSAIMTLLLVHTLRGSAQAHPLSGPWPELAAALVVIVLQWRLRNTLLSIALGTVLYVVLRNSALIVG